MGRPDYIICLECESEVDQFSWWEGEVRKAVCDVCGNNDPDRDRRVDADLAHGVGGPPAGARGRLRNASAY